MRKSSLMVRIEKDVGILWAAIQHPRRLTFRSYLEERENPFLSESGTISGYDFENLRIAVASA